MNEEIVIHVLLADGTIQAIRVDIQQIGEMGLWSLKVLDMAMAGRSYVGDDLFEAMIELRKDLEQGGSALLCAGARQDVFPSGMSRSMSDGRKAYVTRIGEPANRSDLIDIFSYSPSPTVGTVQQQSMFHAEWVESLRQR
ncbi:MAG: hypothetical protein AB7V26_14445 [Lysobacterales bacterium]